MAGSTGPTKADLQDQIDSAIEALEDAYTPEASREDLAGADGLRLAYSELGLDGRWDLWTLPLDVSDPDHPKPGKPQLFLHTPANELFPAVSPDARWIAYRSDESGRYEVYVRPFPPRQSQIFDEAGQLPAWSRNGRKLFFQNLDNRIMVTDYMATADSFVPDKPHLWSDQQLHKHQRSSELRPSRRMASALQYSRNSRHWPKRRELSTSPSC